MRSSCRPDDGGAVNPARTFGPYLTTSLFGGDTPWSEFGVYIIGPIVGAVLAVLVYDQVARPVREVPEEGEQGTAGEISGTREPRGEAAADGEPADGEAADGESQRSGGRATTGYSAVSAVFAQNPEVIDDHVTTDRQHRAQGGEHRHAR